MRLDDGQIEVIDDVMVEIYKKGVQWSGFRLPLDYGVQPEYNFVLYTPIGMKARYNEKL